MTRHHTKKNEENETCPVKIDRVEAEIQAYTHTHTHTRTHTHTHTHTHTPIHTDTFKKSCILIPHTSENNYNMFLQHSKNYYHKACSRRKQKSKNKNAGGLGRLQGIWERSR